MEKNELDWHKDIAVWESAGNDMNPAAGPAASTGTNNPVRFISKTPESYSIAYNVTEPGVVFVSQSLYPGWIADGGRLKMVEVFGAFQGIIIPQPGHGEITVRFSPTILKVGILISLVSGVIAVAMVFFGRV